MPTHSEIRVVDHPVGLSGEPRVVLAVDGEPRLLGELLEDRHYQLARRAVPFDHRDKTVRYPQIGEVGGHPWSLAHRIPGVRVASQQATVSLGAA